MLLGGLGGGEPRPGAPPRVPLRVTTVCPAVAGHDNVPAVARGTKRAKFFTFESSHISASRVNMTFRVGSGRFDLFAAAALSPTP